MATVTLLHKFSSNLRDALKRAQNLAMDLKHQEVKPEHMLYALLTQKGSLSAEILLSAKINPETVRNFIVEKNVAVAEMKDFRLSKAAKDAILKATKNAHIYRHKYIGTEHLLLGLLETGDENLQNLLQRNTVNVIELKARVIGMLDNISRFPDLSEIFNAITGRKEVKEKTGIDRSSKQKNRALDFFGTDLTDEEIQNGIDPVIGREEEIERVIQILCRRTKNNPILLGEAGVGKTAIVEGLAKKIIQARVPEVLLDKKIFTLDISLMVSGAMFRGEFEARLKQVLDEIREDRKIIVFIDEIHTIIGAGSAGGSMDVANILKPALARGEIRCIGATTFNEYRKSIENDPALERRFQPIRVSEPTENKAIEILRGIKKNYELFHQVEISDEAVEAAVKLSKRYLPDKFLPDKAIDLLDEAAAKVKIQKKSPPMALKIKELTNRLINIQKEKQEAIENEQFENALRLKEIERAAQKELNSLKEKNKNLARVVFGAIDYKDIAKIVSQITQIPLAELAGEEKNRLLSLEKILSQKIIGQEQVIKIIAQAIRRSRTGVRIATQPIGSFMFLGPSGVGKTELAKIVARTLFGHDALVRIDMNEFAESFNISKLIGAPAGYVGYKEGGKLSEAVKNKPYCVVLLDEIEKAHPDIFNLLLQILDEGYLTDAIGKKIDFRNTVIIMTSNIGLDFFNKQASIGFRSEIDESTIEFNEFKKHIKDKLKDSFKPEFINRLDQILIFNPLTLKNLEQIVKLKIAKLNERLKDKRIVLKLNSKSVKWLAEKNFDANSGARAVVRNIAEIENMLAESLLRDKFRGGDFVKIEVKDGKLTLEK